MSEPRFHKVAGAEHMFVWQWGRNVWFVSAITPTLSARTGPTFETKSDACDWARRQSMPGGYWPSSAVLTGRVEE